MRLSVVVVVVVVTRFDSILRSLEHCRCPRHRHVLGAVRSGTGVHPAAAPIRLPLVAPLARSLATAAVYRTSAMFFGARYPAEHRPEVDRNHFGPCRYCRGAPAPRHIFVYWRNT